jgi:hypothetical protein
MSTTLALIGAGWESVRSSAAHGRRTDALRRIRCLLARPDLPAAVAVDAHRLAGELLLEGERFAASRRHLRLAAKLSPQDAQLHYLWGLAHERDPHGNDRREALLLRKASQLEPTNSTYRAAFGRAAVRSGRSRCGVRELLAAAAAAPGDVSVIRVVVDGLLEAQRFDSARLVLNRARFLCFEPTQDRVLAGLWERVRFESARSAQVGATRRQDAAFATDGGRVILPFLRRVSSSGSRNEPRATSAGSSRRDVLSLPRPHWPKMPVRRADG